MHFCSISPIAAILRRSSKPSSFGMFISEKIINGLTWGSEKIPDHLSGVCKKNNLVGILQTIKNILEEQPVILVVFNYDNFPASSHGTKIIFLPVTAVEQLKKNIHLQQTRSFFCLKSPGRVFMPSGMNRPQSLRGLYRPIGYLMLIVPIRFSLWMKASIYCCTSLHFCSCVRKVLIWNSSSWSRMWMISV